jgi:hypothetical protein
MTPMETGFQGQLPPNDGEIVVIITRQDGICADCDAALGSGNFIRIESGKDNQRTILCMECADLGHLSFLPRGDAAITRRATKYSTLRAVVVQWSRSRKRYERQGILVEQAAVDKAEEESLADADVRRLRQQRAAVVRARDDEQFINDFTAAVQKQYPNCPLDEAATIARHACTKHSGRVGRSAAAKAFDYDAIRLAVTAHIRHVHTNYDALLARHADRRGAREQVWDKVQNVLERWSAGR